VPLDRDEQQDRVEHPVLVEVLPDDELQVVVLPGVEVHADAVARVVTQREDPRDPDAAVGDVVRIDVLPVVGEEDRLVEEAGADEHTPEPRDLVRVEALLEDELAVPCLGRPVADLGLEAVLEPVREIREASPGRAGQLRIRAQHGPAHQLLSHRAVERRLAAREVGEQAEQVLEDLPYRRRGGPRELCPVAVHAPAERVETARLHVGAGDGGDALLAEERSAAVHERGEVSAVVGNRLVQQEHLVRPAAHGEVLVARQGLEPPPHQPAHALAGARQALRELVDGAHRPAVGTEERLPAEAIRLREVDVGRQVVLAELRVLLLRRRQEDLLADALQGRVPAGAAGRERLEGGIGAPEQRLTGEAAKVDGLAPKGVLQVADPDAPLPATRTHAQVPPADTVDEAVPLGLDVGLEHAELAEEPARHAHGDARAVELDRGAPVELGDLHGEVRLDGLAAVRALRRQLALLELEVAREQREVDDALVGGQVAVAAVTI
jgi:hypothetical protein